MRKKRLVLAALLGLTPLLAAAITPARAGLFGESDEEKAARIHEQNQDASISDLTQRVHDLEESLRRATGQNESLSHQVQELNDRIDRQKKDFEYRLCALSAQQLGAPEGSDEASVPCGGAAGTGSGAPAQQIAPQQTGTLHLAPPPGVLGTLPAGPASQPAPSAAQGRSQFDAALDLLAKARYDDARAAFRSYADSNPADPLTPQAVYWIGDISFAQKDYAGAARAFAEEIKKYPTSTRAPDSMLKLGQSLIALGQVKEGCTTLGAIPSKYPSASKAVTAKAATERKASCR
ncbi:MAG TPA: tol-pal system protein YbgF [Rhizomicrobium sp.]|jgi:tol-pal system protein YbgF|nr:tol-pal system protein YbgF [Rhizomicrobium sp.]